MSFGTVRVTICHLTDNKNKETCHFMYRKPFLSDGDISRKNSASCLSAAESVTCLVILQEAIRAVFTIIHDISPRPL
jgi:hypothetical protein